MRPGHDRRGMELVTMACLTTLRVGLAVFAMCGVFTGRPTATLAAGTPAPQQQDVAPTSDPSNPVAATLSDVVAAYRKIIVLVEG